MRRAEQPRANIVGLQVFGHAVDQCSQGQTGQDHDGRD